MRYSTLILAMLFATSPHHVFAGSPASRADVAPFDFAFRVSGDASIRPVLVFYDGIDTFIQMPEKAPLVTTVGVNSHREGAYLVVDGHPSDISVISGKFKVAIHYSGAIVRPAPREQERQTPVAAAAPAAAPVEKCVPKNLSFRTAMAVAFAPNRADLSGKTADALQSEFRKNADRISQLDVTQPTGTPSGLATKRVTYLKRLGALSGIPPLKMSVKTGSTLGGSTLIEMIMTYGTPCSASSPLVDARGDKITVLAHETDVAALVKEIAQRTGRASFFEGTAKSLPISITVLDEPIKRGLAKLADAVGSNADLILRPTEIVLRYTPSKVKPQ